ncbi:MAG: hypothetical protein RR561_05745 [Peptostreptococcus sp.]|uniref:hypothetical protein n=1 Tax=Peptostreptococcus sp. TaxID=1262 RepID=UPI002FCC13D7
MAKKKKKEKAYYEKDIRPEHLKEENKKKVDLFSNPSFMIAMGFLIVMYSRMLAIPLSARLIAILGLGVMGSGVVKSIKIHRGTIADSKGVKRYSKTNLIIDYIMILLIVGGMIFNAIVLFKTYF